MKTLTNDILNTWIEALRSGAFAQASSTLVKHHDEAADLAFFDHMLDKKWGPDTCAFCCLGVLAVTALDIPYEKAWGDDYLHAIAEGDDYPGMFMEVPEDVRALLEDVRALLPENFCYSDDTMEAVLIRLNDSHLYTFDDIADILDKPAVRRALLRQPKED